MTNEGAALIAVDWGTSNLRAMLLAADGAVVAEVSSGEGIARVHAGAHAEAFAKLVASWPNVPALMAGMIGSRQGWREAPYAACPATATDLAAKVVRFTADDGRPIAIIPGVMVRDPLRDGDVIRGEETQIVGVLAAEPGFAGLAILPGTHSKWVSVADGAIADFQTYLTGEMFELLARQSFLRHSVAASAASLHDAPGFALAVRRIVSDGVPFLGAIFSVRARYLLDRIDPADNLAYLSGLVIGGEIAAAMAANRLMPGTAIRIVGTPALAEAYRRAFAILDRPVEIRDGAAVVTAGLVRIARAVGLLAPEARQ